MFADAALAARIDRAEGRMCAQVAEAIGTSRPASAPFVLPISGGQAVYVAPSSPLNKVIGLCLDAGLDVGALERIEGEWGDRGEPVRIEMSVLADPLSLRLASTRRFDNSAIIAKIARQEKLLLKTVPATEAKNRFGAILDHAQREPVVIRRQDRDIAVVLSMADYERLRSGNIQAFLDLRKQIADEAAANGLTEKSLNELLADDDA
ncbi:MAG TPA: type II toxin-antitoxin system Phd/YefM family antitoxin [Vicinamibacterales bacterium]|jgi:prevent-host-death family protein